MYISSQDMAHFGALKHMLIDTLTVSSVVCGIISRYGDLDDNERTISMLNAHNGVVRLFDNQEYFKQQLAVMLLHTNNRQIIWNDGYNMGRARKMSLCKFARYLRRCRQKGIQNLSDRDERLAPLWSQMYDLWISM
jgi:hypothetical protein